MKRFLMVSTILSSIGVSSVATADKFSGFHTGIHGGYAVGRFSQSLKAGNDYIKQPTLGGQGITLGLNMGYQQQMNERFLLGLGGDLSYHNAQNKQKNGSNQYAIKQTLIYGLHGKVGFVCKEVLTFMKLGVDFGHFKLTGSAHSKKFEKIKNTHPGLRLGLGMEYGINDRLIVGGEFKHTIYKTKAYKPSQQNQILTETVKVSPSMSGFLLTAKYQF